MHMHTHARIVHAIHNCNNTWRIRLSIGTPHFTLTAVQPSLYYNQTVPHK